ncbi:hypothetical protein [Mongoliitalea daihaiensis]|uniref:hypothetical protein n=1 Tax=Mongoliitalea daihaiensis TaxID=2782006 RepID=UPI001F181DE2|nr:hypothetical protein [Mongoliitalea daihaiensis]UJP64020.1 hypothetical protein IPZ59_14490 [Mongoliitalea daihaiensis]
MTQSFILSALSFLFRFAFVYSIGLLFYAVIFVDFGVFTTGALQAPGKIFWALPSLLITLLTIATEKDGR